MKRLLKITIFFVASILFPGVGFRAECQPVPVDPAIKIGKLPNGLTYYIRHNEEPKERASFYIIQNVGAMLEEDDQNGLAHFLEHMAFNGTLHFPGKGIINTLEKHGVAFGRNINAGTGQNETVYNLSDVPVKKPGLIDTCLLILNDWSDFITLSENEIDLERGVITEEWRTGQNAGFRMQKKMLPVMFKDSRYANRDVIGDTAVIRHFGYDTLRKFYKDWYRTDLQAIAVVGDINADEIESKIKDLFGKIPAEVNPIPRPFHEIPFHNETRFVLASDPEATNHSISIYIKIKGIASKDKDLKYYRDVLDNNLFNRMMGDRISELLQKGDPPFINGGVNYGGLSRGYNMMSVSATAHPNKVDQALRAIYTEAMRVYRYGFTASELERAKSNMLTQTENQWKQKDKISNDRYASAITSHFLVNEPLESMDMEWKLTKKFLSEITLDEVSARAKKWITEENRTIVEMGPEGPNVKLLSESEALAIIKEVEASKIEPYKDKEVAKSLINKELAGSKVIKTKTLKAFDAVEWTLGNHAKVIYRKADFQKDNVLLQATSPGGNSLYAPDKLASAMMLGQYMSSFGVGDFDAIALRRMLTGKNVSLGPNLSNLSETFSGSSSPKDFETMLQLLYLYFEQPRFDKEAYKALTSRLQAAVANMNKNPQKVMSDSLQLIMNNYSKRVKLITPEIFNEFSLEQMEEIYRDRFKDAGDFKFFIVGNIDESTVKPLVEKYIGSLNDDPRKETWKDNKEGMPEGKTVKEIKVPLQTDKANVRVAFNNKAKYSPKTNLMMNIIRGVLDIRYVEEIREKEGGTYGVGVMAGNARIPENEKTLQMVFDTDPAKADYLKSKIYSEVEKIAASGPTKEDMDKVVKNMLKDREQAKPNNSYWMGVLTGYYQNHYNSDAPENFENIMAKLTVDDVKKFAATFMKNPKIVDVIFKPLK